MSELTRVAVQAIGLMDLTSLNEDDTENTIQDLCRQALTPAGPVAAVCVYPRFVRVASQTLKGTAVSVATVTNFPDGGEDIEASLMTTMTALDEGADEIDLVFPYKALMAGNPQIGEDMVLRHAALCHQRSALLKVIIETGELQSDQLIALAAKIAIESGADFVKTSTGKVPINATPEAAGLILREIANSGRPVGLKVAGGVRTTEEAAEYMKIASDIFGNNWLTPAHFRFGASSLLTALLAVSGHSETSSASGSGSGY